MITIRDQNDNSTGNNKTVQGPKQQRRKEDNYNQPLQPKQKQQQKQRNSAMTKTTTKQRQQQPTSASKMTTATESKNWCRDQERHAQNRIWAYLVPSSHQTTLGVPNCQLWSGSQNTTECRCWWSLVCIPPVCRWIKIRGPT